MRKLKNNIFCAFQMQDNFVKEKGTIMKIIFLDYLYIILYKKKYVVATTKLHKSSILV